MQINICSRTGRKVSIKACICSESPSFSQNIYIHLCKCVCMGDELYKQYSLTSVFFYIHDIYVNVYGAGSVSVQVHSRFSLHIREIVL